MYPYIKYITIAGLLSCCAPKTEVAKYGRHYQKHKDFKNLSKAVDLMPKELTTKKVKKILGKPYIDNGFDYRYLVDSTGANNCNVGAVFTIDNQGIINQKWVDEICE